MEKISRIVGTNSPRVGATDPKNGPAVRPGAPAFGRQVGVSPAADRDELSTAQKVTVIQNDLAEQKKARAEAKTSADISAQFFARHEAKAPAAESLRTMQEEEVHEPSMRATSGQQEALAAGEEPNLHGGSVGAAPSRYTPRGTFVDVRA